MIQGKKEKTFPLHRFRNKAGQPGGLSLHEEGKGPLSKGKEKVGWGGGG